MRQDLFAAVLEHDEIADLDPASRRLALRDLVALHGGTAADLNELADAIDGFGPLTSLMDDPAVTDILVNGPEAVWIERDGGLERTDVTLTGDELMSLIYRLADAVEVRVDIGHPLADARLADGSRLHVALPPVVDSPCLSIRRFGRTPLSLSDLLDHGMMDGNTASRLRAHVEDRRSVLISGATGTGKTTLLNALLSCAPPTERIVTLEESRELRPEHPHVVSLSCRGDNMEGKGAVTLADLVRTSLRMRPDRIVVGEVRGPEAWDALAALSTGHDGSAMTIHAGSAPAALARFASLAAAVGAEPYDVIRQRVQEAFGVIVQLGRRDGDRRIVELVQPE